MSCSLDWGKRKRQLTKEEHMYIFSHKRVLYIFLCHSTILSHRTGKKRNTAKSNLYEDIFLHIANWESSDAYRANTGTFSKKIAGKQQIIRVMMKFYGSTGGIIFKEKIA